MGIERVTSPRIELKRHEDIVGNVRINARNYTEAFVSDPSGGHDVLIGGVGSRKGALDGDIVKVKIKSPLEWKLNWNTIADKWDQWSKDLQPILDSLEVPCNDNDGQQPNEAANDGPSLNDSKPSHGGRHRRHAPSQDSPNDATTAKQPQQTNQIKLPPNLPPAIAKLKVEDIFHLSNATQILQKTGTVCEIIKHNHSGYAGGLLRVHGDSSRYALFSPTDSKIPRMLIDIRECPLDFATESKRYEDVLFIARIDEWDGQQPFAKGNLHKIVGDCNSVQTRIEALLVENAIYDHDFPPEVYQELEYLNDLPAEWFEDCKAQRRDLTNECIFTIDPKTARDLDDAVSIKRLPDGIFEVGVHIADVSFFVKELTSVDYYARMRTTSVYLVDRVIPMLPRLLCEQMCSLNPGEPKLTYSVIWKLDKHGKIIDEWFGRTVIQSCVKLAYEQAQDLIDREGDVSWIVEGVNMPELYGFNWCHISKSVRILNEMARSMRAKRFENGALKIEQTKLKFELDKETGLPLGFNTETRTEANFLIEEFMLLANISVARRIYKFNNQFAFLRRHPPSCEKILKDVKDFCEAKGCELDITSSGSLQRSLNAIKDPNTSKVISFLLLRAMKGAEYVIPGALPQGDNDLHHFALNVPLYTHFTSPIRRYPDIIVHRLLSLTLKYETESHEDLESLRLVAEESTKRKIASKHISDTSQKLYFNLFVQKAGSCVLTACVTRIYDQSFDVILVDCDITGRVYLNKSKPALMSHSYESQCGVKRLVLKWQPLGKKSKKRQARLQTQLDPAQEELQRSLANSGCSVSLRNSQLNDKRTANNEQVIQVFDLVKVMASSNEKDFTLLDLALKQPDGLETH